jgi:hypothetical protein
VVPVVPYPTITRYILKVLLTLQAQLLFKACVTFVKCSEIET